MTILYTGVAYNTRVGGAVERVENWEVHWSCHNGNGNHIPDPIEEMS